MWTITNVDCDRPYKNNLDESEQQPQISRMLLQTTDFGRVSRQAEVATITLHINKLKKDYHRLRVTCNKPHSSSVYLHTSAESEQPAQRIKTIDHSSLENEEDLMSRTYAPARNHGTRRRYSLICTRSHLDKLRVIDQSLPKKKLITEGCNNTFIRPQSKPNTRYNSPQCSMKRIQKKKKLTTLHRQTSDGNLEHEYIQKIGLLKNLYEQLSEITFAAKDMDQRKVVSMVQRYLQLLFCKGLAFVDAFLLQLSEKQKRPIIFAQLMERVTLIYLMLGIVKDTLKMSITNLVNMLGHCASNLILLSRMFLLSMKKHVKNFAPTMFEQCIRKYEISSFNGQLFQVISVMRRMHHNNEILIMLESKTGRNNHRFSTAVKKLLKGLQREETSVWLISRHLLEYLAFYLHDIGLNGKIRYLDCAPGPYLTPTTDNRQTLVLELHGVLFLYKGGQSVLRNFAKQFFDYVQKHFELVVWTWLMPSQTDSVLDIIASDRKGFGVLYRYHCQYHQDLYMKNLNRLGRDLDKVLIIDYDSKIFANTPHNGISIGWSGNEQDTKLMDLSQILLEMLTKSLTVKDTLCLYQKQISFLANTQTKHGVSR